MTNPPTFPSLPVGWSVHKKPTFSTLVAGAASGREIRAALYQYPLWEFELTFEGLAADASFPGLGAQSLQSLMGFFLQRQGQFGQFLYVDPSDNSATLQSIGSGDGATLSFTMPRTLGGFAEPVGWVTSIASVYLNGVSQASGWSLAPPNALVFAAPPGVGVAITATFSYAFVCRFLEDVQDFEEFMQNLWALQSLKFRSVRTS
jgi:uncharacterized protein (TIGR02217 family)